jgi:Tol biopolymer transport system component
MDAAVQSTDDDWFPTPSAGDTQLFFYSFRPPSGGADIWVAVRATPSSPFAAPEQAAGLSTPDDEVQPSLTDDARLIAFAVRPAVGTSDVFTAERSSATASWGSRTSLDAINSTSVDFTPFISGDGLRIWFASNRPGGRGGVDLYEATRISRADTFGAPRHVFEASSADEDTSPTLSADGLELFFASARSGGPGLLDVYVAHRPSVDQPFATPTLVAELSTAMDEYGLRLSRDGTTMYLNYATLVTGSTDAALYSATRTCM